MTVVTVTVYLQIKLQCCFLDFFGDECTEDAAEECREFRVDVPLSEQFDAKVFKDYCE